MDKLFEALTKILPQDQVTEVAQAVDEVLQGAKSELEAEFNQKLEEAYNELSGELAAAEKVAEQGYEEAYAVIQDLRQRLEGQRAEFEKSLEEGYEEAYQMLVQEREKNNTLEVDLHGEYEKRLQEVKEFIVDKVDAFLQFKGAEIYEQAKRDVLNDPRLVEHKLALDRIVDITADYLTDEDYAFATSSKVEDLNKKIEELAGQVKIAEARNIRLSHENNKLTEQVRQASDMITEATQADKQQRAKKAPKLEGKGHRELNQTVVIAETVDQAKGQDQEGATILEGVDLQALSVLAGIKKAN